MELRALILDDDDLAAEALAAHVRALLPGVRVECREQPDCSGSFDLYFVDNAFGPHRMGPQLVSEIRAEHPDSIIVAVSGTLDREVLLDLLNAGCDIAFEKGGRVAVRDMLKRLAERLQSRLPSRRRGGARGVVSSLLSLVRELNRHAEERREVWR